MVYIGIVTIIIFAGIDHASFLRQGCSRVTLESVVPRGDARDDYFHCEADSIISFTVGGPHFGTHSTTLHSFQHDANALKEEKSRRKDLKRRKRATRRWYEKRK